jgi:hypothetical protein
MRQRAGARRQVTRQRDAKMETDGKLTTIEREVKLDDGEAEAEALISRLAVCYAKTVAYYMEYFKDDDKQKNYEMATEQAESYREFRAREAKEKPLKEMQWTHLSAIAALDTKEALELWGRICDAAYSDISSGFSAAEVVGNVEPFQRAQFLALREYFMEGWNPRNGIERTLIDMLAQEYNLYLHWTKVAHERMERIVENHSDWQRQARDLGWLPPSQSVADAIDRAYKLADGYHRQFMRTLRQLRDLRRYVPPVIVNNGGQVNVATNGGQQVNVNKET